MELKGTLADMSMINVLRTLLRNASSGKAVIWNKTQWALIWLVDGQAVSSVVLNKPDKRPLYTGEQAVANLFTWADGFFSFSSDVESASYPVTIKRPTGTLIIEALQRDSAEGDAPISPQLLHAQLQLLPQMAGTSERINLTMEEWYVLTHIGQQSTTNQIVAQTGLPPKRVLLLVSRLIDHGLIVRSSSADYAQHQIAADPTTQRHTVITNLMRALRRRLQHVELGA